MRTCSVTRPDAPGYSVSVVGWVGQYTYCLYFGMVGQISEQRWHTERAALFAARCALSRMVK